MEAIVIDRASDELRAALEEAEASLRDSNLCENERSYKAAKIVLARINKGEKGLHDPENSGDRIILLLASWDD